MERCRYLVFLLNDYIKLCKTVPAYSWLFIYFLKGSDRQSEVVELSMQYCAQIL